MPRVGFKPTIPVFERVKTVVALDSAAAVVSNHITTLINKCVRVDVLSPPCMATPLHSECFRFISYVEITVSFLSDYREPVPSELPAGIRKGIVILLKKIASTP
jgi:hypothetical protein